MKKVIVFFAAFSAFTALAQDPSASCIKDLANDARLQILADKFVFDVSKGQPLEVLANKEIPNSQEKIALSFLATESDKCLELGADWRKVTYNANVNALVNTFRVEGAIVLSDLYAGNSTFGDVAKIRSKKAAEFKNAIEALQKEAQIQKDLEFKRTADEAYQRRLAERLAWQQQEENRRRDAIQALQNFKPLPIVDIPFTPMPLRVSPPNRTQTTNCTTYRNSMNCVTN